MTFYASCFTKTSTLPTAVDAVYILGGNPPVRVPEGASLFKQLNAKTLLISKVPKLRKDTSFFSDETQLSIDVLHTHFGLTPILLSLNNTALTSTYEEALALKQYAEKQAIRSIVIVTDAFHSQRAYYVFKDALDPETALYVVPVANDSYSENNWWLSESGISHYILEPIKLLNYHINQKQ